MINLDVNQLFILKFALQFKFKFCKFSTVFTELAGLHLNLTSSSFANSCCCCLDCCCLEATVGFYMQSFQPT